MGTQPQGQDPLELLGIPEPEEVVLDNENVEHHIPIGAQSMPSTNARDSHDSEKHSDGEAEEDLESHSVDMELARTHSAPLYTVFSKSKIRFIVFMATLAAFISPLSAFVYYPALNALATDLHVSSSNINLTLTTYMIFQGLAPTIFGDLGDAIGRRPVFIIGFIIYIAANIGIALQDSFAALLVLRCMQSFGSSSTVALSAGVAADVCTAADRGKYLGWVSSGIALGPALGPVLGGILGQFLGWRSIFWFLVIVAGLYMIPLVIAFPETGRNVVGNGSFKPQRWNMSLLSYLATRHSEPSKLTRTQSQSSLAARRQIRFPNPFNTLRVIANKDVGLLLFYNAIVYTTFIDVVASTPYLFGEIYHFNDLQIGLCYIPYGVAGFVSPLINGRLLDWNFRRVAARAGIAIDTKRGNSMRDFPLEEARVPVALPMALLGGVALICYGWVLEKNANLAAALVLQFIIGLTVTGCFQVLNVMIVDYYPNSPATATAANNIVRCWIGAGGSAVIVLMIDGMGRGWCFTFIGFVVIVLTPILLVLKKWGMGWRMERARKEDVKQEMKEKERTARKA